MGGAFKDEVFFVQRVKTFVYLLWSKTKLSIVGEPSTLVGFIDWLDCESGRGFFCLYILIVLCSSYGGVCFPFNRLSNIITLRNIYLRHFRLLVSKWNLEVALKVGFFL